MKLQYPTRWFQNSHISWLKAPKCQNYRRKHWTLSHSNGCLLVYYLSTSSYTNWIYSAISVGFLRIEKRINVVWNISWYNLKWPISLGSNDSDCPLLTSSSESCLHVFFLEILAIIWHFPTNVGIKRLGHVAIVSVEMWVCKATSHGSHRLDESKLPKGYFFSVTTRWCLTATIRRSIAPSTGEL